MGAEVVVYTYPELVRLIAQLPGVEDVITGDKDIPEDFDYWVASASLPGRLEIDPFFDSPYLRAIPADIERFVRYR
jgi:hypothetical protein